MNAPSGIRTLGIAVIAAALSLAAPALAADSVAGTWNLEVKTSQGTGTPTLTLKQEGEKVSGTYKGRLGEAPVTGTVKGNALNLTFKISSPMGSLDVEYAGTVKGDTIEGTTKIGPETGSFTGKRAS
jgi:hypothetical protein